MATTTNYSWTIPTVGGDTGAWGTIVNAAFVAADASLKLIADIANAALAKAGGIMTGRVDLWTATIKRIDKGSISGAQSFDISLAQYFTLTVGAALQPSFSNVPAGTFATGVVFRMTNAGAFVITWPASVKWAAGAAPVFTAAGVDMVIFITDDNGVTWRGVVVAKDIR
jgi:hypothetical protein